MLRRLLNRLLPEDVHLENQSESLRQMDFARGNTPYPACGKCQAPVCGASDNLCRCPEYQGFRDEYQLLADELKASFLALQDYHGKPFRPSRNSFGFGATVVGGVNLFITHTVTVGLAVGLPLLIIPAALLIGFVYVRGRREEQQIIADAQHALINYHNLLNQHRNSVTQRLDYHANHPGEQLKFYASTRPVTTANKEKRDNIGNSLSHYLGGLFGTLGALNAVIQFTGVAALLGGPATWIIAISLAAAVGIYFAVHRYQYLVAKKKFDRTFDVLANRKEDISNSSNEYTHAHMQKLEAKNTELMRQVGEHMPMPVPSDAKKVVPYSSSRRHSWSTGLYQPAPIPKLPPIAELDLNNERKHRLGCA